MSVELKNLITRAAWTFFQTFVAVWIVLEKPLSTEAVIAAAAAGLSAVKTLIVEWLAKKK